MGRSTLPPVMPEAVLDDLSLRFLRTIPVAEGSSLSSQIYMYMYIFIYIISRSTATEIHLIMVTLYAGVTVPTGG